MGIEGGAWHVYGDWALLAVAASAAVFVLLYLFLSPWWQRQEGRNIMAVMGGLALAAVYFAWVVQRGSVPQGFWPARALLFTVLFLGISWRVVIFIRAQLLVRSDRKEREDSAH
jgi:hypothetical protein